MSTVSDLDTWRLFFKIVSRGSIAKVSEEIGVEASSISRRINKLEKDLGVELFRRKGKQLVLTSAGSVAYSRMRRIVFDAASLFKDHNNLAAGGVLDLQGRLQGVHIVGVGDGLHGRTVQGAVRIHRHLTGGVGNLLDGNNDFHKVPSS